MIYLKYLHKLNNFTRNHKIKVEHLYDVSGNAEWVGEDRVIRLNMSMTMPETVAAWLHELGHALDETLVSQSTAKKIKKAYPAAYKGKHTKAQAKIIIEAEIRAWAYAKVIAKDLDIKLGSWFSKQRRSCLKNYEENL